MLEGLKKNFFYANVESVGSDLVIYTWGRLPEEAVHNAVIMEQIAEMAYKTKILNHEVSGINSYLLDKHYFRKHGVDSYYGQ